MAQHRPCPRQGSPRSTLHWPLVFPEVFLEKGGFDAIVGNPPYLGGGSIGSAMGAAYRGYLGAVIASGRKAKKPDIVSFFFLRAFRLVHSKGILGLLATNSISQGDTREIGLDVIHEQKGKIFSAIKSAKWPTRSAAIYYAVVWIGAAHANNWTENTLDGHVVSGITTALEAETRAKGNPCRLNSNRHFAYVGSQLHGIGFTVPEEAALAMIASDPQNAAVVLPFLGGEDLNQEYRHRPSRYVLYTFVRCLSLRLIDIESQSNGFGATFGPIGSSWTPGNTSAFKITGGFIGRHVPVVRQAQQAGPSDCNCPHQQAVMPVMVPTSQCLMKRLSSLLLTTRPCWHC